MQGASFIDCLVAIIIGSDSLFDRKDIRLMSERELKEPTCKCGESEICNCRCHHCESVKHLVPCCEQCPHCEQLIKIAYFQMHIEDCFLKTAEENT